MMIKTWLSKLLAMVAPASVATLNTTPLPLDINPATRNQLARHAGRLANLYSARMGGDRRKSLKEEISMRVKALEQAGCRVPDDEAAARLLFNRLLEE